MAKVNFTAGRVAGFQCQAGRIQCFLWDAAAPGLGLRATANGAKSYIFQSKINDRTVRITIGAPKTWSIGDAQAKARELKVSIDNGEDPRQVIADELAAKQAAREAKEKAAADAANAAAALSIRESVTLAAVWPVYIADRAPHWGERHTADHIKMIKVGGEDRTRSHKKTQPAPLASLANVRLVDLTTERIDAWAKIEAATRPTTARLAWRMLKACLNWCAVHHVYKQIVTGNPAKSKTARESLGKAKVKNDVLQREQLAAWFSAVHHIANPVISAYLQCLLLTGARRGEVIAIKWEDIDFRWNSITIRDKVDGLRVIPLTPYVSHLLDALPRRNEWVFSSKTAADGKLADPTKAHNQACTIAGIDLSLHGLRRSFASLCEWTETPAGIAAQIQGHAPQGVREQNYIRRPLDLLRMWHVKIEAWILHEAGIAFATAPLDLSHVTPS